MPSIGVIVSWAKWLVIAGVLTTALTMCHQYQRDQVALRDRLIEANRVKASVQAEKQELENANKNLLESIKILEDSQRASSKAIEDLNAKYRAARERAAKEKRLRRELDLQLAANEEPERVEALVNTETQEQFDELERLLNN